MDERNCSPFRWSKAESDMSLKELAERSVSQPQFCWACKETDTVAKELFLSPYESNLELDGSTGFSLCIN